MNKTLVIFTALLLSGCAAKLTQLTVPNQIEYHGKQYQLAGSQDLDTIARYVYLTAPDTLQQWQSQIEVLFDRNHPPKTIPERIALRERIYHNTGVNYFAFQTQPKDAKQPQALTGYVIYTPSTDNPSWQVNIMKGQNMPNCGFVQFQYSQKVQQPNGSVRLTQEKVQKHLYKYLVEEEGKRLQNLTWPWVCQK